MTTPRLVAIGFNFFFCTAVAWFTLGGSVVSRTGESDEHLAKEVAQLLGGHHNQVAPSVVVERRPDAGDGARRLDGGARSARPGTS